MSGPLTSQNLLARSQATIATGSKSFAAAARLFAPETRESVVLLYAWCRYCDDLIDGQRLGHGRIADNPMAPGEVLAGLRERTRAVFRGEPPAEPEFAAFAAVVRRHAIPEAYALAHLDGFAMDVEGRVYRSFDDTLDYCYRVAGVVGLMMAHVMGVRRTDILDRACDLGIAFQLTNIARDVIEDAQIGRVYLPEKWLEEAGIPVAEMVRERHRRALAGVVARLLREAEPYYASAAIGIAYLPPRSAWAIATALRVYRAIGSKVVQHGSAAWDERVATSRATKLGAMIGGGTRAFAAIASGRVRAPPPRQDLWTRPRCGAAFVGTANATRGPTA
ncbi:MAG: phytoene/squalene synthase family protein [Alphaproteobacteria bacterium]